MTNKERYENFYKERGLEEFINLIVKNYLSLSDIQKELNPADVLLGKFEETSDCGLGMKIAKYAGSPAYVPKDLRLNGDALLRSALCRIFAYSPMHGYMLGDIVEDMPFEEVGYYVIGTIISMFRGKIWPVWAIDYVYSTVLLLQKVHGVIVYIYVDAHDAETLNITGKEFVTGVSPKYELLYGLQKLLDDPTEVTVVPNQQMCTLLRHFALPYVEELEAGKLSGVKFAAMLTTLLSDNPISKRIPSDMRLRLLFNLGMRLLASDSNVSVATNLEEVLKAENTIAALYYKGQE